MVTDLITGVLRATDLLGRVDDDTLGILMPSTPASRPHRCAAAFVPW